MKKRIRNMLSALTACATLCTSLAFPVPQSAAAEGMIAFPGAVGGGRYATGGRGGEVYHVTNLNDSGEGSFRDAVSKSNRIVVFDVSGTIELKSNILCQSNITIAGQTAPGGSGITLKNYKLGMAGDNIICRFLSSRPGPYASTSSGNDAWGDAKGSNSIIDHCSMGFTTDEQWGLYSNNQYYTVQYSVIGPADSWGGHSKGVHGFGLMMGKGYLTFDHNLIIHNVSRNFRGKMEGQQTADFTNNVIYNWAYQTAYGTIGHLNYVNNTLKMGNGTTGGKHYVNVDSSTKPENFKIYIAGNRMLNQDGTVYDAVTGDNWNGITVKDGIGITKNDLVSNTAFETLVNGQNVSTAMTCESAENSYEHVVTYAGNGISPTQRTTIDQQCAEETRTGTGYHSGTASYDAANDSEKANIDKYHIQCGVTYSYPDPVLTKTITDADNDGMDDEWEELRGLDPSDPTDTNGDYCGLGYTNIEYYINDLTVNAFPEGVVTLSPETGTPLPVTSAFSQIEAESFTEQEGVRTEDTTDDNGVQNIGFVENGDYVMYKRIDFEEGARSFTMRISGNACTMELYLDSLNTPVASVPFAGTSGFSDWQTISMNIPAITGTHNLYIKFMGGEGYLMNVNWFTFGKETLPLNGVLVKQLTVKDEERLTGWTLGQNAAVGSAIFGDRDFTFTTMPDTLAGAEQILTACDSKNAEGDCAVFTAGADAVVYIALDDRVENVPEWMAEYTKTEMTLTSSNDVVFDVYSRSVKEGEEVTLGANGQSYLCVNYAVLVKEQEETPTEPESTEPVTETTEPESQPEATETSQETDTEPASTTSVPTETTGTAELYGDVDEDGKVQMVDMILLNKYLMIGTEISPQGLLNADVNQNGEVMQDDALNILRAVIKLVTLPL